MNNRNKKTRHAIAFFSSFIISGLFIYVLVNSTFAMTAAEQRCRNMRYSGDRVACFAMLFRGWNIREDPAYSNRGYWPNRWNSHGGCAHGSPWCASFVSHMLTLGRGSYEIRTCGAQAMRNQYHNNRNRKVHPFNGGAYRLYPGDVLYRSRPSGGTGAGHVGIVVSYSNTNGGFTTVEGNTKCANIDNDCVRLRWYNKDGTPRDWDNKDKPAWESILRW
jgi:hypothetical protein